jgi:hypothetical protein
LVDYGTLLPEEAQEIRDWNQLKSAYPDVLDLDIKVSCDCPAFVYWGSAYIVDQLDSGDTSLLRYEHNPAPEHRPPNVRDPGLDKTLCKHLASVLQRFFR